MYWSYLKSNITGVCLDEQRNHCFIYYYPLNWISAVLQFSLIQFHEFDLKRVKKCRKGLELINSLSSKSLVSEIYLAHVFRVFGPKYVFVISWNDAKRPIRLLSCRASRCGFLFCLIIPSMVLLRTTRPIVTTYTLEREPSVLLPTVHTYSVWILRLQ